MFSILKFKSCPTTTFILTPKYVALIDEDTGDVESHTIEAFLAFIIKVKHDRNLRR